MKLTITPTGIHDQHEVKDFRKRVYFIGTEQECIDFIAQTI